MSDVVIVKVTIHLRYPLVNGVNMLVIDSDKVNLNGWSPWYGSDGDVVIRYRNGDVTYVPRQNITAVFMQASTTTTATRSNT